MKSILGRRAMRLLIALLMAVGLVGLASPASASPRSQPGTYLALGDSVPFGYWKDAPPIFYRYPQLFVGYPEFVGPMLGLHTINASCPGETTQSFITGSGSNGCEDAVPGGQAYRQLGRLHVNYSGTQLGFATDTLEHNRSVRLVTLMLGANDAFLCQKATEDYCTSPADIAGITKHVGDNLAYILGQLHATGYAGPIVVVNYYALNYNPADPNLQGTGLLNEAIANAAAPFPGVVVADAFSAFGALAARHGDDSVAAGLVRNGDVHPTLYGQFVLARTVVAALKR